MATYLDGVIWTFSFVLLTYVHYRMERTLSISIFLDIINNMYIQRLSNSCSFLGQTDYRHASLQFVYILLCLSTCCIQFFF